MSKKNRIRLWTDSPLSEGGQVMCSEPQRHYLINVMRRSDGDSVYLFNGRDGEFEATLAVCGKKDCRLDLKCRIADFAACPDIWLLFAPLKKDQTDFAVAKAVELGVSKIIPVQTEWTVSSTLKSDRLKAQVVEAAEQSRRLDLPEIEALTPLEKILDNWSPDRKLIFMDESGQSGQVADLMPKCSAPAAVLIGPEAGFSQKELENLRNLPYTCGISLGKRILRAETAVVAALSCWQAFCGDWKK